jgi:RNA polymerase sigma factor (sigma-70 family)
MNTRKQNDALVVALLSGQRLERSDQYEVARILYSEYIPMVYAYLRKWFRVCSPCIYESIVIETIERVTRSILRFDPHRAKFTTFMIGFADRVAKEMLRKELQTCFLEEIEEDVAAPEPSGYSISAETLLHELLIGPYAACLENLHEKYRVLIEMAIEAVPPEKYQEHFNVNAATYRKRKERAIKELREIISIMGPSKPIE